MKKKKEKKIFHINKAACSGFPFIFLDSTQYLLKNKNKIKMVFQEPKNLTEFKALIAQDNLVVVDFHATWCGPCKLIAPKLAKLTEVYTSAVFAKVDVDDVSVSIFEKKKKEIMGLKMKRKKLLMM